MKATTVATGSSSWYILIHPFAADIQEWQPQSGGAEAGHQPQDNDQSARPGIRPSRRRGHQGQGQCRPLPGWHQPHREEGQETRHWCGRAWKNLWESAVKASDLWFHYKPAFLNAGHRLVLCILGEQRQGEDLHETDGVQQVASAAVCSHADRRRRDWTDEHPAQQHPALSWPALQEPEGHSHPRGEGVGAAGAQVQPQKQPGQREAGQQLPANLPPDIKRMELDLTETEKRGRLRGQKAASQSDIYGHCSDDAWPHDLGLLSKGRAMLCLWKRF